ncbi:uncharacterized protein [Nicotiana tomentosiformis]|uniref:uncharacterized protein n=1 Tax=Nicotiana tomentosiformis TaxID=4098 RepID=UPI00388CD892
MTYDSLLELLRFSKDPELRSQIIDKVDKIQDNIPTSSEIEEIPSQKGPYTIYDIKRILRENFQAIDRPTTVQDLKNEINNLKEEISDLKASNIVLDKRIIKLENSRVPTSQEFSTNITEKSFDNIIASTSKNEAKDGFLGAVNMTDDKFLQRFQLFTTQKFLIKVTLLIDYNFKKEFTALFDSGADLNYSTPKVSGNLTYISPFIKDLAKDTSILYERLKKNPKAWIDDHSKSVRQINQKVNNLPCLTVANPSWAKVVETDASDIGYDGILKQCSPVDKQEYLVQFYSEKWNNSQKNYATVTKKILAIVKCVLKFQIDLYNQKFLIKTYCQITKFIFNKDCKHDVSKHMFARWQALLAPLDLDIIYKTRDK